MKRFISIIGLLFVLAGCTGAATTSEETQEPLVGDAANGETIFQSGANGAPSCVSCHTLDGTNLVGPSLQGFGAVAGTRIEGQSAEEYAHSSIVRPANYIVDGYGNLMYTQYERMLSQQEIADLVAYILAQ